MGNAHTVVIGGGIAGLACAHRLASLGVDVVLLEASDRVGGKIETINDDGVQFEAGPNTVVANKQGTLDLIEEAGLAQDLIDASPTSKARYIALGDRIVPLPMNPVGALTSPLLGPAALLRALTDLWRGRPANVPADESVADFVERRFGRRILDKLVEPALAGIYAGDVRRLEARSVLKKLTEAEQAKGSVIRGMIALGKERRKRGEQRLPMRMVTFRDGLEVLPRTIASGLGDRLRLSCPVERIDARDDGCTVHAHEAEPIEAERVVIAIESDGAARLVRELPGAERLAAGLAGVMTSGICIAGLVYDRDALPTEPSGFGYLSGPGSPKRTLGCLFRSSLFPHSSASGEIMLTAFLGGATDDTWRDLDDAKIVDRAHADIELLLGARARPRRTMLRRWDKAISQYNRGHHEVRDAAEAFAAGGRVSIIGGALTGISINDCIEAGRAEADRLSELVARSAEGAGACTSASS
jgi:oxygen-dependent protoporphyrinogen oxidase